MSADLKLGVQEQLLEGVSPREKYRFATALGFDGIELQGAGDGGFAGRLDELKQARSAGVVMPSVCVRWTTSSATSTRTNAGTPSRT